MAIRGSCYRESEKDVKIEVTKVYHESLESWWYAIVRGGVTGYESVRCDKIIDRDKGWWACAGTKGRWDSLFVPLESLRIIVKELR